MPCLEDTGEWHSLMISHAFMQSQQILLKIIVLANQHENCSSYKLEIERREIVTKIYAANMTLIKIKPLP